MLEHILDSALLGDVGLEFHLADLRHLLLVVESLLEESLIGIELGSEVEIMQKSVFLIADVHKCRIESGHDFLDLRQIEVAYRVSYVAAFLLERDKAGVFKQSD